jgi:hypothetical protein
MKSRLAGFKGFGLALLVAGAIVACSDRGPTNVQAPDGAAVQDNGLGGDAGTMDGGGGGTAPADTVCPDGRGGYIGPGGRWMCY